MFTTLNIMHLQKHLYKNIFAKPTATHLDLSEHKDILIATWNAVKIEKEKKEREKMGFLCTSSPSHV